MKRAPNFFSGKGWRLGEDELKISRHTLPKLHVFDQLKKKTWKFPKGTFDVNLVFTATLACTKRALLVLLSPYKIGGGGKPPCPLVPTLLPVRGLCSGICLGKSNRNRYLFGCRDHQCCRHINACFFPRELRVDIREERIINDDDKTLFNTLTPSAFADFQEERDDKIYTTVTFTY